MLKLIKQFGVALALTVMLVAKAQAVFIGFSPSAQPGATGDFVSLDLIMSGLGNGAAPSVGDFDVDIAYDMTRLAISSWSLGSELGDIGAGDAIDLSLGDLGGILALAEVSFLSVADLDALQGDTVTLATINFDVLDLEAGESTLVTIDTIYALGDGFGRPLDLTKIGSGLIYNGQIPEPSVLALLAAGLVLLRVRKR